MGCCKRRHPFTLIELMIVLAILAMIAGVVGINIRKAYTQQRFRSEVDSIVDQLRLSQDLMLITGADVHLKFTSMGDEQGLKMWMEVEGQLTSKEWEKLLNKNQRVLTAIHAINFEDELEYPVMPGVIDIRFLSAGNVMSRGMMRLSTHEDESAEGSMVRAICLLGHPSPLFSVEDKERKLVCNLDEGEDNERITQATREVIFEIFQNQERLLQQMLEKPKKSDKTKEPKESGEGKETLPATP